MTVGTGALAGVGVLVTRPAAQADGLCKLIEGAGGVAHRFPVLEICAPRDPEPLRDIVDQLDSYDCVVFVSANAVQRALDVLLEEHPWPGSVRIAVIGRRSAKELERYGLSADLCPDTRFDSEGLLALPALQAVNGQRFVIFRGDGGREYLAETLRQRGASVDYIEAYSRIRPDSDATPVLRQWQSGAIDVVVVNSAESLCNLWDMLDDVGQQLLKQTPVLLVSERMLPLIEQLGLTAPPLLAGNATDEAVVKALLDWQAPRLK
jgi:uroporphyrinogen-III synthase